MITLTYSTTTAPDFGGFRFYIEEGRLFDAADYADAYGLNLHDIDADSIKAVQDATGRMNPGEWLEVTHDIDDDEPRVAGLFGMWRDREDMADVAGYVRGLRGDAGSDLVLCESADGWSLHAPGSTDDEIAEGDAPYLVSGQGRPTAADYAAARAELARRNA